MIRLRRQDGRKAEPLLQLFIDKKTLGFDSPGQIQTLVD